jgi:hypothetical protein
MNSHNSCVYYDWSRIWNYSLTTNDNEQMRISYLKSMFLATKLRLVWYISSNNESNDIHSLSLEKKSKLHYSMYFIVHVLTTITGIKNGSLLLIMWVLEIILKISKSYPLWLLTVSRGDV